MVMSIINKKNKNINNNGNKVDLQTEQHKKEKKGNRQTSLT